MLLLAFAIAGCGSSSSQHRIGSSSSSSDSASSSSSGATTSVSTTDVGDPTATGASAAGRPLPSGWLGLSMQYKAFPQYAGANASSINPAFLNLIRDIAPNQSPSVRFGGDSTDWTWWPVHGMRQPGGVTYVLTPKWVRTAKTFIGDLHPRLILGINLEANSVRVASTEAHALVSGLGRRHIAGLEIGNEPELYAAFNWYRNKRGVGVPGRNVDTWTESAFFKQFHQFAAAMPSGLPVAGPASGSASYLSELGAFLRGESRVKIATFHAYPLKHCTAAKQLTIGELLSPAATSGFARAQARYVNAAHRAHKLVRLDEMNGITCGGFRGVSNTFASALWVLDTLYELDHSGVDGVNIQTVPGGAQEIFGPRSRNGGPMIVHPEFYGLMMFAQGSPTGSRLISLHTKLPPRVKLWATRSTNGTIRATLINDNFSKPATVKLPTSGKTGGASVEALRAAHIGATGGVTLGGRSFGRSTSTGRLPAPKLTRLKARGGHYSVRIPPATAVLVTMPASATATSNS